ncbi:alkanesulfonate monooxygenase SsuD/methylene tetrahydromethanopterin reductase-like flavin-dependent oxidoreductase (luciferase family) [Rhodoligotrophos appendicifer]|uniref:LLM class flavin-dependent oxidoreductase n=1 Tax=Rhodoligotrophos appendicifer TaxID=987056 RepID=UPI001478E9F3|nr:LLM class flavin-dependent oxidoreductase [Rhodoligotrophos appendicifer]
MLIDTEFPNAREGVFVPPGFATPDEMIDIVKFCEDMGYNALWGTDFITPTPMYGIPEGEKPDWYEPLISIAFCAAHTSRIKLGTGLILAPFREPVILAKQVAAIDQFSKGRMLLGLGLGMCRDEFEALNPRRPKAHRGNMMEESIELLQRFFSDEPSVTHEGEYYAVKGVSLYPKPVQKPMPIYVPLRAEGALDRIARFGLGVTAPFAILPDRLKALEPHLEKYGRSRADVDAIAEAEVFFGKTREDAIARYQTTRHGQFRLKRQPLEAFLAHNFVGTVDDVLEGMMRVKEAGIEHFNILHVPGDTIAARKELLQTFSEEIMPKMA